MLHAEAEWKEGNTNPLEVLLDTPDMWSEDELNKALAELESLEA